MQVVHIKEVDSTNKVVKSMIAKGELSFNTAIMADFQTNGRGQGENAWESSRGLNLLSSFYLKMDIEAADHFQIVMAISLILKKVLVEYNLKPSIKWPNDIYVGDSKIAGVLIENRLLGSKIKQTIIGVGLNVNQLAFSELLPNPISMKHIAGKEFNVQEVFNQIIKTISSRFYFYISQDDLIKKYSENLYRRGALNLFKTDGGMLEGKIIGVKKSGELIITDKQQKQHYFLHGEVAYVI